MSKTFFNVIQSIAADAEVGHVSIYRINYEEEWHEEVARFCAEHFAPEYLFKDEDLSAFEEMRGLSGMTFIAVQKLLCKGEYVLVVKTEDRVQVSKVRPYDSLQDNAPLLFKKPPSHIHESLLDVTF